MLTLSTAFSGSNPAELFNNIEHKTPKSISAPYTKRLIDLCGILLNKEKERRPHIDEVIDLFPKTYHVPLL